MLCLSGDASIREVSVVGTCNTKLNTVIVVIACKRISSIQLYSSHSRASVTECSPSKSTDMRIMRGKYAAHVARPPTATIHLASSTIQWEG